MVHGSKRWRLGAVGLAALGILLSGWTAAATAQAPPVYVALGDSYTAGPVIPVQQTNPAGCLRSDHNYPHLLATARGLVLHDVSCSGATTADMTSAQNVTPGPANPPQLDALTPDTKLVTIGIGGNDIGFVSILENCAALTPVGPTRSGASTCQSTYVSNGDDKISDAIRATAPKVGAVLDGIHQRSPSARVYVVDYLDILPVTGNGCWPQMPLTYADVPYLRAKEVELNGMLATTAAAHHARLVDAYTASIGRDTCQLPTSRWVEPVVPINPAAPVHPNAAGMVGTAAAVAARVVGTGDG
jgi:lysophospholipase L1-like esterase